MSDYLIAPELERAGEPELELGLVLFHSGSPALIVTDTGRVSMMKKIKNW